MSEFYEDDAGMIEPDPAHIAYLDQQSAAFESEREEFRKVYGFDHECTCGMDYTANRVGLVTECFLKLSADALNRCAYLTAVNNTISEALHLSVDIANDLVKIMQKHGLTNELDEYFRTQVDLDRVDDDEIEEFTRLLEEQQAGDHEDDGELDKTDEDAS